MKKSTKVEKIAKRLHDEAKLAMLCKLNDNHIFLNSCGAIVTISHLDEQILEIAKFLAK